MLAAMTMIGMVGLTVALGSLPGDQLSSEVRQER